MSYRWWWLDLAAEFPELEIYTGHGWGPEQELGLIEIGDRAMTEQAFWLPTWFYSREEDRIWAGVLYYYRSVTQWMREHHRIGIPPGWRPDVEAWDEGRLP